MGKETTEQKMMTYISKARHYFNGKDFIKAIENFKKAIKIDKPMAKQLGIVGDLERAEALLKEQQAEPIRGLGTLYLEVLNIANNFIPIHQVFITEAVKDDMRLPPISRTRFVKAESVEELEAAIAIVEATAKEASKGDNSESNVIIKDLNEKLLKAGESLKKAETKEEGQAKVIKGLEKRVKLLETKPKEEKL